MTVPPLVSVGGVAKIACAEATGHRSLDAHDEAIVTVRHGTPLRLQMALLGQPGRRGPLPVPSGGGASSK